MSKPKTREQARARFRSRLANSMRQAPLGRRPTQADAETAASKALAMYEELSKAPNADEMDFMVARPPELQEVGKTMSAEALADLSTAITTYLNARVAYHWGQKPGGTKNTVGPSVIKAEVRLTIDGVHGIPEPDERPWYIIDGQGRAIRQHKVGSTTHLEVEE